MKNLILTLSLLFATLVPINASAEEAIKAEIVAVCYVSTQILSAIIDVTDAGAGEDMILFLMNYFMRVDENDQETLYYLIRIFALASPENKASALQDFATGCAETDPGIPS